MEPLRIINLQGSYNEDFIKEVELRSGQQISKCYQCGNCGASCNYTWAFDYPVNQIMRLIQLGQKEIVIKSRSIWQCAACTACTTRCPCNIEVTKVMETLRVMAEEERAISLKDVESFYTDFLKSVKLFGRVFEAGLLPLFNIKRGTLLRDMDLAPKVMRLRKIHFIPKVIKGRKEVSEIYERFENWRRKSKER